MTPADASAFADAGCGGSFALRLMGRAPGTGKESKKRISGEFL
jgi:hypothetical protein